MKTNTITNIESALQSLHNSFENYKKMSLILTRTPIYMDTKMKNQSWVNNSFSYLFFVGILNWSWRFP